MKTFKIGHFKFNYDFHPVFISYPIGAVIWMAVTVICSPVVQPHFDPLILIVPHMINLIAFDYLGYSSDVYKSIVYRNKKVLKVTEETWNFLCVIFGELIIRNRYFNRIWTVREPLPGYETLGVATFSIWRSFMIAFHVWALAFQLMIVYYSIYHRQFTKRQVAHTDRPVNNNERACVVCLGNLAKTALPCGHVVMCLQCSETLLSVQPTCPVCRIPFRKFIKLFID